MRCLRAHDINTIHLFLLCVRAADRLIAIILLLLFAVLRSSFSTLSHLPSFDGNATYSVRELAAA